MKDYYKVLGVKETASMDEIRDRWVELVREFHPDQEKELDAENEEKVRDINEAYQVLKHPSTRVEYDLKRAFEGRKKGFKRVILPVSAALVLIIGGGGIIYLGRPGDSSISRPIISSAEAPGTAAQSGPSQQETSAEEVLSPVKSEIPAEPERVASSKESKNLPDKTGRGTRDQQQQAGKRDASHASQPSPQQVSKASLKQIRPAPRETAKVAAPEAPRETTARVAPTIEKNAAAPAPSTVREGVSPVAGTSSPKPVALIAEEGEIRQFLANYKQRYTQRDPDAFLQLFSSGAVQNRGQNLEDIQYVYRTFFEQSEDLQYDMEDASIEIYQNAAEVNARFRINQTLKRNGEKRLWKGPIRWVLVKEDADLKIGKLDYQPHQVNRQDE